MTDLIYLSVVIFIYCWFYEGAHQGLYLHTEKEKDIQKPGKQLLRRNQVDIESSSDLKPEVYRNKIDEEAIQEEEEIRS